MSDDVELLRRYAETRAEDAFGELVRRRLKLVYSVALRQCGGDVDLASEVTQRVFCDLARKARTLSERTVLSGWLYRSARFAASDAVRAQRRRRAHEQEASMMNQIPEDSALDAEWRELRPVLDDVLSELGEADRDAVMLRFFEDRGFREVGAALRLSEDAARMRVDRALERLRRMLARRGVTSTASALGLALAHQAGATPPAGLAASVMGAAVGGVATGAAAMGFMSAAKMNLGVVGAVALLLVSTATNVWLGTRPAPAVPPPVPSAPAAPAGSRRAEAAPAGVALAALQADPATLRDQLRAAGFAPPLTRAIVEGLLRRQYREKLSELRAERARDGWWRMAWAGQIDIPPPMNDDMPLLQTMVFDRLEQLFGPDPDELALYETRFAFLPADKRAAAIALERAAARIEARGIGVQNGSGEVAAARAREEQRAQFLAALTPAESAEYALRGAPANGPTTDRMRQIDASEAEFRAIMEILGAYGKTGRPADAAARAARDDLMMQEMVKAIGFERAIDYIWSAAAEYPIYARVARDEKLPEGTAGRMVQLAAETTDQAIAISRDPTLDRAQKRAAALALQETVRGQLDALIPPAAQARLTPAALQWFTGLATGHFQLISTALNSAEGVIRMVGTQSVESPWPVHVPVPPLPRRSAP